MRDIHAMAPGAAPLDLQRVGVQGVRKPLVVQRPERAVTLTVAFSVAVDLPANRKGSDLSRNAELLAEVVDQTAQRPVESLESACSTIARELLRRHPYAHDAEVTAEAEYFVRRGVSPARESLEDFRLFASAIASTEPGSSSPSLARSIGVEAVGMTTCPCAMETAREQLLAEYPRLADPTLADLPIVTHNQRNRTRLDLDLPVGVEVEVDEMLAAVEAAQSSPTYAILKRGDEAAVVLAAHRRPRFVEDVVRELLTSLPARFPSLPDATGARVVTRSEESIHKYDVTSSHATTLGALRPPTA
jgi:GTP cyclohydrolase IV